MTSNPGHDPFDLEFEADDEFTSPASDAWRETPMAPAAGADPFADFPPAREPEIRGFDGDDALADDLRQPDPPRAQVPNPVHEMIAGAEAALGEHTLPRITIHVFCAQPETADLVERAAADRRMERAAVVVRMGGLTGAFETYQNQPTPSLVMVESLDPAPQLIAHEQRILARGLQRDAVVGPGGQPDQGAQELDDAPQLLLGDVAGGQRVQLVAPHVGRLTLEDAGLAAHRAPDRHRSGGAGGQRHRHGVFQFSARNCRNA